MNEPSKVILDYHKLEQLFSERARLYQREEELGRLRNRLCDLEDQLAKVSNWNSSKLDVSEKAGREDAFNEVRAMLSSFDFSGLRYRKIAKEALDRLSRQIDVISPPF